jgi:hypothetical protein
MASKRQTTMAKIAREQAVRERRARKQEKRDKKRAARAEKGSETAEVVTDTVAENESEVEFGPTA